MQHLDARETWSVFCSGVVQGVGFRPAVANLAARHRITGVVANIDGDVLIKIQGRTSDLQSFVGDLLQLPSPVRLEQPRIVRSLEGLFTTFEIETSVQTGQVRAEITPDQAICSECATELRDLRNRRFGYSQIACNQCGPRFGSIISLPFDRVNTTYADFDFCDNCRAEYLSANSRRFHGQLISCPICGPRVSILGSAIPDDQVAGEVAHRIMRGEIGLIKGLSGVHLVCRADSEAAVGRVRCAKVRPVKPFAVMVPSLSHARRLAYLTKESEGLLQSAIRPVVVAPRREAACLAGSVGRGLLTIGIMLPSSGFYVQLLENLERELGERCGLICTSANISGQSVPAQIEHVESSIASSVDFQVDHSRRILTSSDDSVFLATADPIRPIRLGRGSTPLVMRSDAPMAVPSIGLAHGSKATICTMDTHRTTLWPHLGSGLFNTHEQFRAAIEAISGLSLFSPRVVGVDLGLPEPFIGWTRAEGWAVERIQHHHAHAVAVAVEHGLIPRPSIIALVCDGFGVGSDGTGWGGEVLEFNFSSFRRLGCVRSAHHPPGIDRRTALLAHSFLIHAEVPQLQRDRLVPLSSIEIKLSGAVFEGRISGVQGGSTGRLFDAVSALLGLSEVAAYEGHAAVLLEQLAGTYSGSRQYPPAGFPRFQVVKKGELYVLDERPFFAGLARLVGSLPRSEVAYWFHVVLAKGFFELIGCALTSRTEPPPIVLAGGCMQNNLFVQSLSKLLTVHGYRYYLSERIPLNDGGLSVGLARIAGARFESTSSKDDLSTV